MNKTFGSAHEWIRTTTPIKAPPPQDGVSTSFTTCAAYIEDCKTTYYIYFSQ
jgi:hypothetical protein